MIITQKYRKFKKIYNNFQLLRYCIGKTNKERQDVLS